MIVVKLREKYYNDIMNDNNNNYQYQLRADYEAGTVLHIS